MDYSSSASAVKWMDQLIYYKVRTGTLILNIFLSLTSLQHVRWDFDLCDFQVSPAFKKLPLCWYSVLVTLPAAAAAAAAGAGS